MLKLWCSLKPFPHLHKCSVNARSDSIWCVKYIIIVLLTFLPSFPPCLTDTCTEPYLLQQDYSEIRTLSSSKSDHTHTHHTTHTCTHNTTHPCTHHTTLMHTSHYTHAHITLHPCTHHIFSSSAIKLSSLAKHAWSVEVMRYHTAAAFSFNEYCSLQTVEQCVILNARTRHLCHVCPVSPLRIRRKCM